MAWKWDPYVTTELVGCEDSNLFLSKTTANQFLFNLISKCFRFVFHSKDTSKSSYSFQLWQMAWMWDPCSTSVLVGCEDSNHFWSKTTANQFLFNLISKCFKFVFDSKDTSKSSYSFQLWQIYITNTTKPQGKLNVRKLKLKRAAKTLL